MAVPSMAVTLGYPGFWLRDPRTGIDWKKVLHGEQWLEAYKLLPVDGELIGRTRIDQISDKGEGRGAVIYLSRDIIDTASGETLAKVSMSTFCRGDGGFGFVLPCWAHANGLVGGEPIGNGTISTGGLPRCRLYSPTECRKIALPDWERSSGRPSVMTGTQGGTSRRTGPSSLKFGSLFAVRRPRIGRRGFAPRSITAAPRSRRERWNGGLHALKMPVAPAFPCSPAMLPRPF